MNCSNQYERRSMALRIMIWRALSFSTSANVCASNNLAYKLFGGLCLWGNVSHPEADAIRQQTNTSYSANKIFKSLIVQIMVRMSKQGVFHDPWDFRHQAIYYGSKLSLEQTSAITANLGLVPKGAKGISKVSLCHATAWEEYFVNL